MLKISKNKIMIAPSILSGDFANMEKAVKNIEEWGGDLVHCDVMDGAYVPNLTFGMPMIASLKKKTKLPLDVHLMINKPERYIGEFIGAGADIITFHPDASENPKATLEKIRESGVLAGVVFNPNIPWKPYSELFKLCDLVLVMSVYAGRGGQSFIEDSLITVREIADYLSKNNIDIPIEIDGGINPQTAQKAKEAGASILVAGNAVFNAENPANAISALKK
ncbi:MAG: ribulose-phosphate 3-epimerase [Firmicutes bacterium]|nr:ribulose-phosphate 3-epimerase [Bacillota bacterium]